MEVFHLEQLLWEMRPHLLLMMMTMTVMMMEMRVMRKRMDEMQLLLSD
jgi:hypothetical protein